MKVGDLVRHAELKHLIGIIIQSTFCLHMAKQRHRVKWLKQDGIVAKRGWNKPNFFGESVLKVISEAK